MPQNTGSTAAACKPDCRFFFVMWVFSAHSFCFLPVLLLQLGSEAGGRSPPPSRYADTLFSLRLPRFPTALMVGLEGTGYMGGKGAGC